MVNLAHVTSRAVMPDQLIPYVHSVSGLDSIMLGECVFHRGGDQGVLVAYPVSDPLNKAAAEESLRLARQQRGLAQLSVLAPFPLDGMANLKEDTYWQLSLPPPPASVKLRNMLRRAAREVAIDARGGVGAWTADHESLALSFCQRKHPLPEGMDWLFSHLGAYLAAAEGALLFSARDTQGKLVGLAVGDFTPFATAFYMFACRSEHSPPGTADALLQAIATEASLRGHRRLNLGLGIDAGIEFFKKKWGACPYLPLVEGTVAIKPVKKSGFWARLCG